MGFAFLFFAGLAVLVALLYALLIGFCVSAWQAQIAEEGGAGSLRESAEELPTASIVVVGRNEAKNIDSLLKCLLAQDYASDKYEIIYVDDHSEDESIEVLRAWAARLHSSKLPQPRFSLLRLGDYLQAIGERREDLIAFKKRAIEYAVQRAKGSWIVSTDADCEMGAGWLRGLLAGAVSSGGRIRLGSVIFEEGENLGAGGWFLRRFQQLDLLGMMLITCVGLRRGMQLANGANWAYLRRDFAAVGGFAGIDAQASGDDMLLLHKIQAHLNQNEASAPAAAALQFVVATQAAVSTALAGTWGALWQQRMRWASKSAAYTQYKIKAILLLVGLFSVLLLLTPFLCVFLQSNQMYLLTAFLWVLKAVADWHLLNTAAAHYQRRRWLWAFFPSLLLHVVYIVSAGLLAFLAKKRGYTWKGRKVR